jgi:hypothetical protein
VLHYSSVVFYAHTRHAPYFLHFPFIPRLLPSNPPLVYSLRQAGSSGSLDGGVRDECPSPLPKEVLGEIHHVGAVRRRRLSVDGDSAGLDGGAGGGAAAAAAGRRRLSVDGQSGSVDGAAMTDQASLMARATAEAEARSLLEAAAAGGAPAAAADTVPDMADQEKVVDMFGSVNVIGEQFGVPKNENQDSQILMEHKDSESLLFGVFDGHGYHGENQETRQDVERGGSGGGSAAGAGG